MKPFNIETALEAGSKACVDALTAYAPDILDAVAPYFDEEQGELTEFARLLLPLLSCVVGKLYMDVGDPEKESARDYVVARIEDELVGWLNDEVRYALHREQDREVKQEGA